MITNRFGPSPHTGGRLHRGFVYRVEQDGYYWAVEIWVPRGYVGTTQICDQKWIAENWALDQIELFLTQRTCGQSETGHRYEEIDVCVGECIDCGKRIRT